MSTTNNKKSTYSQIAELSGVSMSTISRILNHSTIVKPETRQKVLSAMKKLGFDTTEYLISSQRNPGDLIIFNIPSLDNPFYSLIIQGAKASAARHQYNLLINEEHINENTIDGFIDLVKKTRTVGVIATNHINSPLLQKIANTIPFVQCCECDKTLKIPFVTIDDIAAARLGVNYLLSLGKKKIALINGPIYYKYAKDRLAGYIEALEYAKIEVNSDFIVQLNEVNYDMAVSAVLQLLNSENRPDAFFCISDVYATAVIKATRKMGLDIPQDIVVVGFDNVEISTMCNPSITTINQPRYQMGFLSCEMLVNNISKNQTQMKNLYLETELLIRESSGNYLTTKVNNDNAS